MPLDQALDKARAMPEGPIVLADMADNAGGGAPCDATFILRAMLERGMGDAVLGCIWDPGAVVLAFEAGEGARLKLRVGGKLGPISGDPLDLDVMVARLARQAMQDYLGARNDMGDCAAVRTQGAMPASTSCSTPSAPRLSRRALSWPWGSTRRPVATWW